MLDFKLELSSGIDISGTVDTYIKYDCLSYHSEAEFKDICENSNTGLEFLRKLGSFYSDSDYFVDNCDYHDVLKKISEIEDFHILETVTICENDIDSFGGEIDSVYRYSFQTGKVSLDDIKQNYIDQSGKVRILFDTTPDVVERILSENGFCDGYEMDDDDTSIIVDKSISDQIVSVLLENGEYASVEPAYEYEAETEDEEDNYPLFISKEEILKWLGVKSIRSIKSEKVKEFIKKIDYYEFWEKENEDGVFDLWSFGSGYVTIDTKNLTIESLEKIIIDNNLLD